MWRLYGRKGISIMKTLARLALSLSLCGALAACVTAPSPSEYRAPQPLKAIEIDRLWSGRWHEVARLPDRLTDGCVAGASAYRPLGGDRIAVRDTCQIGTPEGREKAISGDGRILDPGTNAKLRVRYLHGFVTWDFWVLDRADDQSWAIMGTPGGHYVWLLSRRPVMAAADRAAALLRVRALGYEKLEFPTPAP